MRALVVGAGIGGLAATVALRQAGHQVELFERAQELHEVGAGLTLFPNAMRALRHLRLAEPVIAAGAVGDTGSVWSSSGRTLARGGVDLVQLYGEPAVGIHRGDLQRILLKAAGEVRLGRSCTAFETGPGGVNAEFQDGSSFEGDLLIGADGLHSVVRAQLLGDRQPRYTGWTAWRGVAPIEHAGAGVVMGRGAHGGWVPIGRRRTYWFACRDAPEDDHEFDLTRFRSWQSPLAELIGATPAPDVLRNDLHDRDPSPLWGNGPVTLLGDAAHPMAPGLGQGACSALEDAVALAAALQGAPDSAAGLRRYELRRTPRTARIVRQSRTALAAAQWANPLAVGLRGLLLRLPPNVVARQQRWLFSYDAAATA